MASANSLDGSGGSFSQEVLELGKDLLDGVQVGRVFRQEEELGSGGADELARTTLPLWLPRLSMMTMSPGRSVGTRTFST